MGILLKIAVFAIAAYTVWTAVMRWYGVLGGKKPRAAPPPQYQPQQARRPIEETKLCPACGAYVSLPAAKCSRADCPHTG
jgi:hypothetical protein